MTDTSELVKRLADHADLLAMMDREIRPQQSTLASQQLMRKAAQAIERLEREKLELAGHIDGCVRVGADAVNRANEMEREIAELLAREGRYREALDQAHAAMWDSYYGKGIAVEYARQVSEVVGEALAAPAPEPRVIPDGAHHSGLMKDYGGRYNPAFKAASTSEAEQPTLTKPQREILHHTKWRAAGRMYCGAKDDADIQALVRFGYMKDCGTPGHLPDSDAYFTITKMGLEALKAQQQEPSE